MWISLIYLFSSSLLLNRSRGIVWFFWKGEETTLIQSILCPKSHCQLLLFRNRTSKIRDQNKHTSSRQRQINKVYDTDYIRFWCILANIFNCFSRSQVALISKVHMSHYKVYMKYNKIISMNLASLINS